MPDTLLDLADQLPLTCSRSGTCCHGKAIWLNPWELARLAAARGCSTRAFRDQFTVDGGIRLRMDGSTGWRGLPTCSQYAADRGCTVHAGRPLACRLYPLGRMRQASVVRYMHEGRQFPCLDGCPEVRDLPVMSVADYLAGQDVVAGEAAQDAYLEIMQDLADGALVLLIDSGLAASGDRATLPRWRSLGAMSPQDRASSLPVEWFDRLTLGIDPLSDASPTATIAAHRNALQTAAQSAFATLNTPAALRESSYLMMALSLHLGRSLNIDTVELAKRWIATAKQHGAVE